MVKSSGGRPEILDLCAYDVKLTNDIIVKSQDLATGVFFVEMAARQERGIADLRRISEEHKIAARAAGIISASASTLSTLDSTAHNFAPTESTGQQELARDNDCTACSQLPTQDATATDPMCEDIDIFADLEDIASGDWNDVSRFGDDTPALAGDDAVTTERPQLAGDSIDGLQVTNPFEIPCEYAKAVTSLYGMRADTWSCDMDAC
eukprot:jgi/Mesvir1/11583/Mv04345-RA.1